MITRKRVTALLAALLVCVGFILPMPANTAANEGRTTATDDLEYWFSDSIWVGEWLYSPTIYYYAYSGTSSIPLFSGLLHAQNQWSNALGITLPLSSTYSSASLRYYAMEKSYFSLVNPGVSLSAGAVGRTIYKNTEWFTTYSPFETLGYYLYDVECYSFVAPADKNYTPTNYIKTITHELGHGLGWYGHPDSNIFTPRWVMMVGQTEYTILQPDEIAHLAQVYND